MSIFGWSYPPGAENDPNAPWNQGGEELCEVCSQDVYEECNCVECPGCGSVGDPDCYEQCGLEPMHDSVKSFCDYVGVEPLGAALRAIDKYNAHHIALDVGVCHRLLGPSDVEVANKLPAWTRIVQVYVRGSCGDFECSSIVDPGHGWARVGTARQEVDALLDAAYEEDPFTRADHD